MRTFWGAIIPPATLLYFHIYLLPILSQLYYLILNQIRTWTIFSRNSQPRCRRQTGKQIRKLQIFRGKDVILYREWRDKRGGKKESWDERNSPGGGNKINRSIKVGRCQRDTTSGHLWSLQLAVC